MHDKKLWALRVYMSRISYTLTWSMKILNKVLIRYFFFLLLIWRAWNIVFIKIMLEACLYILPLFDDNNQSLCLNSKLPLSLESKALKTPPIYNMTCFEISCIKLDNNTCTQTSIQSSPPLALSKRREKNIITTRRLWK